MNNQKQFSSGEAAQRFAQHGPGRAWTLVLTTYFIRQFFGDFRQKSRVPTEATDLNQSGWLK
jgi:hypothetical protein